jgi:prepilin-type N-terminal cleavage/methylation domain-containing protein
MSDTFSKVKNRGVESEGFTLIELMIVILIIAILVGIAVAVMYVARTAAWNNTAKANERTGNTSMDNIWLYFSGMTPSGNPSLYNRYYDGNAIWAQAMSRYETKTRWVDVRRAAANQLYNYGAWKNNALEANTRSGTTYYYTWNCVYGKIGLYYGYRNTTTNQWVNTATSGATAYNEVTVIVLTQGTNKAYYTSYRLGQAIATGSFTWTPTTGTTVSFGGY